MRQDDRVTSVTYTLPAGHQWTTAEAALREAHDREYELRMAFFRECQRLKAEVERLTKLQAETLSERNKAEAQVERLTKAGDAMQDDLKIQVWPWASQFESIQHWLAAKEGNTHE